MTPPRRVLVFLLSSVPMIALPPGLAASAGSEQSPVDKPRFEGRWKLNREQSEEARDKMPRPGGGGPGRGGPGRGFGGGRRGGLRGGGPRGGGDASRGSMRDFMQEFLQPPENLTITQSEAELTLDDGSGGPLRLSLDGQKTKRLSGAVETQTKWKGPELVVESAMSNGPKITATYSLLPAKEQLQVVSRLEGRFGSPTTVRRVYDTVKE